MEPVFTTNLVAGLAFFALCATLFVCVTVYHVMTDDDRLRMKVQIKELEVQQQTERMKVLGPLAEK
jgi:hypothetical protein